VEDRVRNGKKGSVVKGGIYGMENEPHGAHIEGGCKGEGRRVEGGRNTKAN